MGKIPATTKHVVAMQDARKLIERELKLRERSRRARAKKR